jgi:hypothetical protein
MRAVDAGLRTFTTFLALLRFALELVLKSVPNLRTLGYNNKMKYVNVPLLRNYKMEHTTWETYCHWLARVQSIHVSLFIRFHHDSELLLFLFYSPISEWIESLFHELIKGDFAPPLTFVSAVMANFQNRLFTYSNMKSI